MTDDLNDPSPQVVPGFVRPFLSAGFTGAGRDAAPDGHVPGWDRGSDSGSDSGSAHGSTLRPFLLTSGRVRPTESIAIETQVISTEYGYDNRENLAFECRDIVRLCSVPLSVAEVAARLSLHLGVVRVLVGDLSAEGYLYAYLPNADASQDVDTLLRVIHGLRAIS